MSSLNEPQGKPWFDNTVGNIQFPCDAPAPLVVNGSAFTGCSLPKEPTVSEESSLVTKDKPLESSGGIPYRGMSYQYSPLMPEGVVYLVPQSWTMSLDTSLFENPWTASPDYPLSPAYTEERTKALGYLSSLLDGLCHDLGLDPNTVWRGPRLREKDRTFGDWSASARVSMVVNNPSPSSVIKGVT